MRSENVIYPRVYIFVFIFDLKFDGVCLLSINFVSPEIDVLNLTLGHLTLEIVICIPVAFKLHASQLRYISAYQIDFFVVEMLIDALILIDIHLVGVLWS